MPKKILLDFEEEENYSIVGITSTLKDYRLIFFLNKLAGINFKRVEPFVFSFKEKVFTFSVYLQVDDENMRNFYLLSNNNKSVKLIKELKHFDYLLVMDGEIEDDFLNNLSKRIKNVGGVMISSVVDGEIVNRIPNLRIEFDRHIDTILK
jgi:hypothetical protein